MTLANYRYTVLKEQIDPNDPDWIAAEGFVAEYQRAKKFIIFEEISKALGKELENEVKITKNPSDPDFLSNYLQDSRY